MTTYNGRSSQYVPGKEVPNKEPAVSKFVVEKLYEVHRKRLTKIEPVVDCHIYIPSFLTNQSWKKNAERSKQLVIRRENQDIYNRIDKLEKEEGYFSKDRKAHVKRLEHKLKYLKKLKDHGRMVNVLKTQKENEHFLKRIERAVPQYSIKKCKEWYKHHEMFKEGRKTDPTGGHIMHTVDKKLLPKIKSRNSSVFEKGSMASSFESLTQGVTNGDSMIDSKRRSKSGGVGGASSLMSLQSNPTIMVQPRYALSSGMYSQMNDRRQYEDGKSDEEGSNGIDEGEGGTYYQEESYDETPKDSPTKHHHHHEKKEKHAHMNKHIKTESEIIDGEAKKAFSEKHVQKADTLQSVEYTSDDSDKYLLNQRAFHLDFDGRNCIVKVYGSTTYDENVLIKVVSTNAFEQRVYVVDSMPIDKVYEIVNTESGVITASSDGDDLQTMSALMIKMFKDADEDNSGSLTFNEFEKLMERVDLGISYQELRFIISEADDNDNGVVDYAEFVPLAVDLLQSFRARNRAKNISTEQDVMIDDEILRTISGEEMESIANACLESIREFDPKKYGLIKYNDLKKILTQVGIPLGLHENEISYMCQSMPLDQFGRVRYHSPNQSFLDSLMKVRFHSTKNAVLAARGSGLQNHLMERCKQEEELLRSKNVDHDIVREQGDDFVPNGVISQRNMINILSTSTKLSLSRLQVIVLMSEATVLDGQINYFQFIPACAKAIELMFEPKALRQRAELIENTDLSSEALLHGLSADKFEQRLATLFKSVDIDHSGNLDQEEFFMCLQSLELQLTKGEMQALFDQADSNCNKTITFDEFIRFFSHNLLNLEREKHLRQLQRKKKEERRGKGSASKENATDEPTDEIFVVSFAPIMEDLQTTFQYEDENETGLVSVEDFKETLETFNLGMDNFLVETVIAALHPVEKGGMLLINDALKVLGNVLSSVVTRENIDTELNLFIGRATMRATAMLENNPEEVSLISAALTAGYAEIKAREAPWDELSNSFKALVLDPHTGLSLYEAQLLINKLLKTQQKQGKGSKSDGFIEHAMDFDFKADIDLDEMTAVVTEVRRVCLMRGLLYKHDAAKFQQTRLAVIGAMKQWLSEEQKNPRLTAAGSMKDNVTLMPLVAWFQILEASPQLRLCRSQVISIFASATCFDRLHENVYAEKFAEHAAYQVTKIHQGEEQEKRNKMLVDAQLTQISCDYLAGWRIKDLEYYVRDAFAEVSDDENGGKTVLTNKHIKDVLRAIPRLKFDELDVATVTAALPIGLTWTKLILPTISTIRCYAKERFNTRRLNLFTASKDKFAYQVMQDLAERLLSAVKINITNDQVSLLWHHEETNVLKSGRTDMTDNMSDKDTNEDGSKVLFRGAKILKLLTLTQQEAQKEKPTTPTNKRRPTTISQPIIEEAWSDVPVQLKISVAGDTILFSGIQLIANVSAVDSSISITQELPVRLPSIGLMDHQSAEDYIENLAGQLYLKSCNDVTTIEITEA